MVVGDCEKALLSSKTMHVLYYRVRNKKKLKFWIKKLENLKKILVCVVSLLFSLVSKKERWSLESRKYKKGELW